MYTSNCFYKVCVSDCRKNYYRYSSKRYNNDTMDDDRIQELSVCGLHHRHFVLGCLCISEPTEY